MVDIRIEGRVLDVFEGVDFSFNYSIADVRDPNKRNTEYSKTIKCPSTPSNDRLFGQIYDVNISNEYNSSIANVEVNFNPNKKASAVVMSDGVQIMNGVVQLRQITVNQSKMIYEVVFIGKLIDIFSAIGDGKINEELDFSYLNHELTQLNIVNSWTNTTGYVYPYIDYGKRIEFNNVGRVFYPTDLRPAIFAKDILDKIFDYSNFQYTSTFLSGSIFSKLIVPFTKETLLPDSSQSQNRLFRALLPSSTILTNWFNVSTGVYYKTLDISNDSTGGGFDFGNNYTTSGLNYLVPENGLYTFKHKATIKVKRDPSSTARIYGVASNIRCQLFKVASNGQQTVLSDSTFQINTSSFLEQSFTFDLTASENVLFDGDRVYFRLFINNENLVISNAAGQQLPQSNFFTDFEITAEEAEFSNDAILDAFEGDLLDFSTIAPECTMKDFLLSIFKMFNLYVEVDPNNDRNLIIETRDNFYAGGKTNDWTYKLARDKDLTLEPLGVLTDREYIYTYSEDGDYYNDRYQDNRGHAYGRARIEVDNDFVQSSSKTEIVFSPTPLVNDNPSNRIIPKIYDSDIAEGASPIDTNIRILYYGGLIDSNPSWELASYFNATLTQTEYPYAGHWDNPLLPTLDINFGLPYELYYQQNSYTGQLIVTNANLYNLYHKNYVEDITNKDGKMLTAYFNLSPIDINKLDFRDQIIIDNSYWRLNKVMNYNPFKDGLTKVELIKIKEPITFKKSSVSINSGGTIGSEFVPYSQTEIKTNSNTFEPFQGTVSGSSNKVGQSATRFKVIGNNNVIGEGSTNITIIGNDNFVQSGLHNVVIINTSGVSVTKSNTTFMNNVEQSGSDIIEGGLNEVRSLSASNPILIVDGGEDIVSNTFSQIGINIVDGGLDK